MPYLEFVMDDVLLRAGDRFYLQIEEGGAAGYLNGQRWRLTARALKIIVAILQNYEINQLPSPVHPSFTPTNDTTLEQILLDFREEQGEYLIEGQTTPVRCDRQVTPLVLDPHIPPPLSEFKITLSSDPPCSKPIYISPLSLFPTKTLCQKTVGFTVMASDPPCSKPTYIPLSPFPQKLSVRKRWGLL